MSAKSEEPIGTITANYSNNRSEVYHLTLFKDNNNGVSPMDLEAIAETLAIPKDAYIVMRGKGGQLIIDQQSGNISNMLLIASAPFNSDPPPNIGEFVFRPAPVDSGFDWEVVLGQRSQFFPVNVPDKLVVQLNEPTGQDQLKARLNIKFVN